MRKKGKVLDMAAEQTKIPIPRELWEQAHVAYVSETQNSVSRQEAVWAILKEYVDQHAKRAAESKNGKRAS